MSDRIDWMMIILYQVLTFVKAKIAGKSFFDRFGWRIFLQMADLALLDADGAMLIAVAKIDKAAKGTPDKESYPGVKWQMGHEIAAGEHCERRDKPDQRTAESARYIWLGYAQHHDADGGDEEGRERTDVGHLGNQANRSKTGNQ